MTLTRRQKKLLITFTVGVTALLVDRVFLRPEGGATEVSADYLDSAETVSAADNLPVLEPESEHLQIALRLDRLGTCDNPDFAEMRDPFSLPPSWLGTAASPGQQSDDPVAVFVMTHQLTAIGEHGGKTGALVDNRFLVPGQEIGGFKLVGIDKRTAIFERDGRQAALELAEDL